MPKSRGRRPRGGGKKQGRRSPMPFRNSDRMLRDARLITGVADPLQAEVWASRWLGQAWLTAPMGDREPERTLCMEVCGRARATPSPHGLAAVSALRRVAPAADVSMLTDAIDVLAETQPMPPWHAAEQDWILGAAWQAVDVWDSERTLLVDFDGPHPHTLMAHIYQTGGIFIGKLAVLEQGTASRWDQVRAGEEVPMPIAEKPAADVLTDLAEALQIADMTWPRNEDEDYVRTRALAWSRCREYLSLDHWSEPVGLPDSERRRLIDEFAAGGGSDDEVTRSLADLFLEYGEGYIRSGPLNWSPDEVMLFLTDWVPRKATLDAGQRQALPDALRQWLTFALRQRGTDPKWITPVVAAVDTHLQEFRDAFDDRTEWGPAKEVAAALAERGVDLTDQQAVEEAMHALNAERIARRLTE